jgi:hypothetical protein
MRPSSGLSLPRIQAALIDPRAPAEVWEEPKQIIEDEVVIERCLSLHFQNPQTERHFARWQIENSWYSIVLLMLFLIGESINVLFIVAWSPWDGGRNTPDRPDPVTSPLMFAATVVSVVTIPIAVVTLLVGTYGCPTRASCASTVAALRSRVSAHAAGASAFRTSWEELVESDGNVAAGRGSGSLQPGARRCSAWWRNGGCSSFAWPILASGYMRERVHPDGPLREILPHRAFKCIPYRTFFSPVIHGSVFFRSVARVLFTCLHAWFSFFEASQAATWTHGCPDLSPAAQRLARAVAAQTPPDYQSQLAVVALGVENLVRTLIATCVGVGGVPTPLTWPAAVCVEDIDSVAATNTRLFIIKESITWASGETCAMIFLLMLFARLRFSEFAWTTGGLVVAHAVLTVRRVAEDRTFARARARSPAPAPARRRATARAHRPTAFLRAPHPVHGILHFRRRPRARSGVQRCRHQRRDRRRRRPALDLRSAHAPAALALHLPLPAARRRARCAARALA